MHHNHIHRAGSVLDAMKADWLARGWPIAELDRFRMEDPPPDPPDPPPAPPTPPAPPAPPDKGFPDATPVAEMTVAQQAAYWRHHARKHEQTVKDRSDYDDLKAKAARLAEIEAANATEQEKAVKAARDEAAAEERTRLAPSLVRGEFRAAAKGVLTDEQRDALLEDLDLTKYLTDTGEVDVDKVEAKVKAFAPAGAPNDPGKGRAPGTGAQGRRNDTKPEKSVAAGRDLYASRRPAKTPA